MKTLLIDGNNLLMRAIYATQHSGMSFQGMETGALTVFVGSIANLIRTERPTHLAVAWDRSGSEARREISADYKANRVAGPIQELKETAFPQARKFCEAANIDQMSQDGFEADDIIANWWRVITRHENPPRPTSFDLIVIASNDKDFYQLLGPNPHGVETELLRLSSADTPTDRWTAQRLRDEKGYEPHQWPLITALQGDAADNVIGIPGIGPKRALAMLKRYDFDLTEAVLAEKADFLDQVQTNLKLVDLRNAERRPESHRPLPIKLPQKDSIHGPEFERFLRYYGLNGTMRRFEGGNLWTEIPRVGKPFRLTAEGG